MSVIHDRTLAVALVQMASGECKEDNVATAIRLVIAAAQAKAKFILLPEVFTYRGETPATQAESLDGDTLVRLRKIARQYKVWILAGSIGEKIGESAHIYNTSALIDPRGIITAAYRKIHLFDAEINGMVIRESERYVAGTHPVMAEVTGRITGLSICYDLRFPELYRSYSADGAQMLCVPSSFTVKTGADHWEVLLRARAIENQCFVLAPNQYGQGTAGVETFGNSMVIDPWGRILARASADKEEIVYATLDFAVLAYIRSSLPALSHRRL